MKRFFWGKYTQHWRFVLKYKCLCPIWDQLIRVFAIANSNSREKKELEKGGK